MTSFYVRGSNRQLLLCRCLSLFLLDFYQIPHQRYISTLFLLLYCSIFACCFSSSVTWVTSTVLILKKIISWLLIFPFSVMRLFTKVDSCDISRHNYFLGCDQQFPFLWDFRCDSPDLSSSSSLCRSDHSFSQKNLLR